MADGSGYDIGRYISERAWRLRCRRLDEMAHHIAVNEGLENAYVPLTEKDIKEILVASL